MAHRHAPRYLFVSIVLVLAALTSAALADTPCQHSIILRDDAGDGWGDAFVDVYVGGSLVLAGVSLADGAGPEPVYFDALPGEEIVTDWTIASGHYQASYCIAALDGTPLGCDGEGGDSPVGITVYGDCTELVCGNDLCQSGGGESCLTCLGDCGDCACASQPPEVDGSSYLSDLDCQHCGSYPVQIVTDDFELLDETLIAGVRFWGSYVGSGTPSEPDQFTLVIRDGSTGPPTTALGTYGPVAGTRTDLGDNLYEYVIDVNQFLPAGNYWLEIYNDTTDTEDTWAWKAGVRDPVYGSRGLAYSVAFPEDWGFNPGLELAFELICVAPELPDVSLTLGKAGADISVEWGADPWFRYDLLHRAGNNTPGCTAPDNGTGTIDFPADCPYQDVDVEMKIADGLPPGSSIILRGPLEGFLNRSASPGGDLGGQIEQFDGQFTWEVIGTGSLTGFNRTLVLPVSPEVHTGPRTPGEATQTFASKIHRLEGQLSGDADFCSFQLVIGSAFGLPGPGETTLSEQPGGQFAVESFFDVSYQIDFAGCAGSVLEGMSGTTTGTARLDAAHWTRESDVTPPWHHLGAMSDGIDNLYKVQVAPAP